MLPTELWLQIFEDLDVQSMNALTRINKFLNSFDKYYLLYHALSKMVIIPDFELNYELLISIYRLQFSENQVLLTRDNICYNVDGDVIEPEVNIFRNVVQVSGGLYLSCFGTVYGWGDNSNYQLSFDDNYIPKPTLIPELSNIIYIASCATHSLFLDDKGVVYGCGKYYVNQKITKYFDNVSMIRVYDHKSLILTNKNELRVSGYGYQPITLKFKVKDIILTGYALILSEDGKVYTFGVFGLQHLERLHETGHGLIKTGNNVRQIGKILGSYFELYDDEGVCQINYYNRDFLLDDVVYMNF